MTVERDPQAAQGLVKRVRTTVSTVFDEGASNGERTSAGVKTVAGASVLTGAAAFAIGESGALASQHAAAIHTVMASQYPSVAGWTLGVGGYIFTITGLGIGADRRLGAGGYTQYQREFIARRMGHIAAGSGLLAGVAIGSAIAASVAESTFGIHGVSGLINDAGLAGTTLASLGLTAVAGARLARGPKPRPVRALTE